jgi:hypothetical protein
MSKKDEVIDKANSQFERLGVWYPRNAVPTLQWFEDNGWRVRRTSEDSAIAAHPNGERIQLARIWHGGEHSGQYWWETQR